MNSKKTHGIRLGLAYALFMAVMLITFGFVIFFSVQTRLQFHALDEALNKYIVCQQCSAQIQENANFLTEQARLFVVTHKTDYMNAYLKEYQETKTQEQALLALEAVCSERDVALQRLQIAIEQGKNLSNMELYAMRLIFEALQLSPLPPALADIPLGTSDAGKTKEELLETAITNLFGDGYLIYKMRINQNCSLTIGAIEQQIKTELHLHVSELGRNISRLRFLNITLLVVSTALFIMIAILVMRPLRAFSKAIRKDLKLMETSTLEFNNLAHAYNEIYDIKAQNEQSLLLEAEYDALTGILNRRAFDQICESSRQKKQSIALLLIDMDDFKYINDHYGHSGGDEALKALAALLKETFREDDYIARIGGDEFAVILPDFTSSHTSVIVRKISKVNDALTKLNGLSHVSISVGVALSHNGYSEDLYKQADAALYRVKEHGKHSCEIFKE